MVMSEVFPKNDLCWNGAEAMPPKWGAEEAIYFSFKIKRVENMPMSFIQINEAY